MRWREAQEGSLRGSEPAAASGGKRQAEIGNIKERLRDYKVSRIEVPQAGFRAAALT